MACVFIKYYSPKAYVSHNPRVLDTRQTENLGGSGTLDFLLENYDLLHTIGKEQLLSEIERFLTQRVNK